MAEKYNLQKRYAALNESLAKLFDESGIRRSFTVPYLEGQEMNDHIQAVANAVQDAGGFVENFITTGHRADGKGWGSADGETVGHPADKLRTAIIPQNDEHAKAVVDVAQKMISDLKALVGDTNPAVQTAQAQLDLVKPTSGANMNLLDFGTLLIQMMVRPIQAIAQAHSGTKDGGHAPQLRAPAPGQPQEAEETPAEPAGQTEAEGGPNTPPAAENAPAAAPAAPEGGSGEVQG